MHELAVTESLVAIVREHVGTQRVSRVVVELGRLSGVMPHALRFCFEVCAAGTPLEGARLEIREVAALARCATCGGELELDEPFGVCACGSAALELQRGRELRVEAVELA